MGAKPQRAAVARHALAAVDRVNAFLAVLLGLGLAVMVICTLVQIAVRFVLSYLGIMTSAPWTEEVARYVVVWIVFVGSAIGCRHAQLISLRFLVDALPARLGRPLNLSVQILSLAFFGLLVWVGISFLGLGAVERSPVLGIGKNWVYAALPVGAALMLINTLALLLEMASEHPEPASAGSEIG